MLNNTWRVLPDKLIVRLFLIIQDFDRERFDTYHQIIDEFGTASRRASNRTQLDTGLQGRLEWPNEGVKIVRLKRRTFKYGVKKEDLKVWR
mgnify:CR=1 FL=1